MARRTDSPLERLKRLPLWQWGLITIFGGIVSNLIMAQQAQTGRLNAASRGEALGRGLATVVFVVIGLVMIVHDLSRSKRGKGKRRR